MFLTHNVFILDFLCSISIKSKENYYVMKRMKHLYIRTARGALQESLRTAILSVTIVLLVVFLFGQGASKSSTTPAHRKSKDKELKEFAEIVAEVYAKIKDRYVTEVDNEKIVQGAIDGMMNALDGHSQFLDSDTLMQLEKDTGGEFSGIGIHISIRDNILTVVSAIPGTPAAKAGLQPWDRIIEIDGKSTENITLLEAVKKLTGPPGTEVKVTIYREGETDTRHVTITRSVIKVQSVYYQVIDDNIGYIRLSRFSEETSENLRKGLEDLKANDVKALILDLRFNTGGLLTEAVYVSELFVPKGKLIVSTKGRLPNQNREYIAKEDPILQVPAIVLVNNGSASASEIVAGALKDHELGVILAPKGQRTFGKGSVQTIEELDNHLGEDENHNPLLCAIRLTTAHYYTPSGVNIEGEGIKPDIVVAVSREQQIDLLQHGLLGEPRLIKDDEETKNEEGTTDEQKDPFYMENLKKAEENKKSKEFIDVQLQFAVDILKSINVLNAGLQKGEEPVQLKTTAMQNL